jgi:hypothetical protein
MLHQRRVPLFVASTNTQPHSSPSHSLIREGSARSSRADSRTGHRIASTPENLHAVQALCHDQRQRFLKDAAAIHVELEAADAGV